MCNNSMFRQVDVIVHLPFTPFHHPLAYALHRLESELSLPGLVVGSMVPDLEIPVIFLVFGTQVPNRMVFHSVLGAATAGILLATAITIWIYAPLVSRLFRLDRLRVKQKCNLSKSLIFSSLLGVLSHVLLDVTNHDYNPVFWPFLSMSDTPSPITPLLGGALTASLLVHSVMALLFVALFVYGRENFWERVLVGR